jgi:hypothetical protein
VQGEKDIFCIAHTSSGLGHLYTIDEALSLTGKLGQNNLKENLER